MPFTIGQFVEVLTQKVDYIQLFSLLGMNSEGWLQAEFVHFLWQQQNAGQIGNFKPHAHAKSTTMTREIHDLCIQVGENRVWCELKSFCTNYCGSPGKNITNRIDDILKAMTRVQERSREGAEIPRVLALLYPFCDGEQEQLAWGRHWDKLVSGPLPNWSDWRIGFPNSRNAYSRFIAWTSSLGLQMLPSVQPPC
jgi:hypothetical protein